ncbi:unnamed protein product, partial [Ectocarpus sp. 12 AP-2014]
PLDPLFLAPLPHRTWFADTERGRKTLDGSSPSSMVGSAAPLRAPSNAPSLLDDFPELAITREDDELLTSLLQESGWGETSNEEDRAINLPIEWVVDIADKDNDWFLATAFGYNDMKQTLHVMVPDGINPTWAGDVAVNQLAVRLLECCDKRSMALFKQLVR